MIEALRHFDRGRLSDLVAVFPSLRVAVLGDFFLDKYLDVDPVLAEPSLETGLPAHQIVDVRHSPGAAGTVVSNLTALGTGSIRALGFRGDDGEGWELERDLLALGVDTSGLLLETGRRTPTYFKPRDRDRAGLAGEHSRYDIKNRSPTLAETETRIIAALDKALPQIDALIVMDQVQGLGQGVVTPLVATAIMERIAGFPRLIAWADSRRRIRSFHGLILKMNQFELSGVHDPEPGSSIPDQAIASCIGAVEEEAGAPVFVTAGDRGVWVGGDSPFRVPGVEVDATVDPTGAGDSFTAGAVLALAAAASRAEAALLGCLVASITVRQLATTGTARPDELGPALDLWQEQNL
ncbi:MAG: PfkB family carbohydrate kinase [Spirochaetota bacterium]